VCFHRTGLLTTLDPGAIGYTGIGIGGAGVTGGAASTGVGAVLAGRATQPTATIAAMLTPVSTRRAVLDLGRRCRCLTAVCAPIAEILP
jgi:hypothetical protein